MTLLLALALLAPNGNASPQEISRAVEPRERDLAFLLETIRKTHPDPYAAHPQADWDQQGAALRGALPRLDEAEFFVGLSRLVALLEDGHSALIPSFSGLGSRSWPIDFEVFDDGLFVVAADPAYAAATGKRVVSLAGRPIAEVIDLVRPCLGADNDWGRRPFLEMAFAFPCLYRGLGLTESAFESRLGIEDGLEVRTIALAAPDPGPPAFIAGIPSSWTRSTPKTERLADRHPDRNYWFEPLPERKAVYFRFASVQNEEDEPLVKFCGRMFAEIASRKAERLVIDLRGNRGGNNYLTQALVHGVIRSPLDRPGGVLVLTDGRTFSAAQNCASYLERETWALFVGAPTGGRPNHFGDAERFSLPESGHLLQCSTVRWQDSDPRDTRRWIQPDLPVATTFADWIEGRDAVLEAALTWEPGKIEGYTGIIPRSHWERATQATALARGR